MKIQKYNYDFIMIMNRLKNIVAKKLDCDKIYDKELANELCITPSYYAVAKRRRKILFEEILYYCHLNNININWILFGDEL
jgi:hypothetical protein